MAAAATKFATKLARKKRKNPRVKVRALLNNRIIDGTINIFILWALFSEDIRVLALPKQADYPIWYTHIFVMATFCLELVARCYSQVCVSMAHGGGGAAAWLQAAPTRTGGAR